VISLASIARLIIEHIRTPFEVHVYNKEKVKNIQSIILVGRKGSSKSALANVLLDKEKFAVVDGSSSGTKEIQGVDFKWKRSKYYLIDTVGIGNTSGLSDNEKIALFQNLCQTIEENKIKQIFFVYKDHFEDHQVEALEKINRIFGLFGSTLNYFTEFIRNYKIIHVDNPPICYESKVRSFQKSSRQKLLNHLESIVSVKSIRAECTVNSNEDDIFKI
ncbi:3813_t:CDS:2, partial [Dentiscutata heterogama]